jgi:4-hydroxythreonine-4-phosphate dehydrogenase
MKKGKDKRPIIAITMGDPAGIGPEIIMKALSDPDFYNRSKPIVIGISKYLNQAKEIIGSKLKVTSISDIGEAQFKFGVVDVLELEDDQYNDILPGQLNEKAGKASIEAIKKAVDLVLNEFAHATVSAPANKESMKLAGCKFPGQTELLADLTGAKSVTTLIMIGNVRIFQVTAHVSLKRAIEMINKTKVLETIQFADMCLKEMGIESPRISIAGLNPHAGENGLFGDEEIREIVPAVEEAKKLGIAAFGPFPCDSLFIRNRDGEFDAICTMYHDQATIAMKLLGTPSTMVVGLPIIRTSVGHGTAFDIAYKGMADASVFKQALNTAISAAKKRYFQEDK